MKNKNLFFLLLIGFALIVTKCGDDEESTPAYVGSWESEVMEMLGAQAKMDFDFTETTFDGDVQAMIAANTFVSLLGVKGTVDELADQVLDMSITDLGAYDNASADYDWKNRYDDPAEFEALYQGFLAASLPKDFEAEYTVAGEEMDLYIEDVDLTLSFTKK